LNEVTIAFVVTRFLLGARDAELLAGLDSHASGAAHALARRLQDPEQRRRAEALGPPLLELVNALEMRHLEARFP
jgi:hypothetical protein